MGEVKKRYSKDIKKDSYVELAGKVTFLLEAQDGRYTHHPFLFDHGGSISTHPLDIHQLPREFLQILLGITFADRITLGFDYTISPTQNSQKTIQILMRGQEYSILINTLLFFSGSMHSWGTTVWSGKVIIEEEEEDVVVKDSWVDPLRQYTEGRILRILEKANVQCVPRLVHEQQVRTQHPITRNFLNHLTHILCSLIDGSPNPSHHDALKHAGILHCNVSLFNLLVLMHDDPNTDFINQVLQEPERSNMHARIQGISRRGLLGDWGDAVPVNVSPSDEHALCATPAIRVEGETKPLPLTNFKGTHSIIIPVADEPLPSDSGFSTDASPLQCTGTWAWMAAELSHIGPGTPVVHQGHHDLESFFYILLAICLLYNDPGRLKPPKVLAYCFDPYFAIPRPSTLKVTTVQSDFGWTRLILPHVFPYFQPLIPLLKKIREELILPIKFQGDKLRMNCWFTHDDFVDAIVMVLSKLPNNYWVAKEPNRTADTVPQNTLTST
ncbi:hypothetical protein JVT61DRAFT_3716 [Boletus reticuloceps]|uniref:Fungal-type protein kinase domain-containing protein n=1 Tax=Boletus reticuloceps TaxID=495285 RepID=A0A8I2YLW5_9AGAM|nr:hypothetical protein JVT61DRAFT_3716 [Boletus reticuloceps]